METPNMEQIKKMSPEELSELNRKLGKAVLKRMLLVQGFKWAAIIGISVGLSRLVETKLNDQNDTNE